MISSSGFSSLSLLGGYFTTSFGWLFYYKFSQRFWKIDWLCWGLTTRQPLWVILCRLPEKGRKETEEIVEEMK